MRRILLLAAVMALAVTTRGEITFQSLSVTATSQTYFLPTPRAGLLLCNVGANEVYYRIFDENDTPAAATASFAVLPAGSAAAPICKSFSRAPTQPAFFKAISVICAAAETATLQVESE